MLYREIKMRTKQFNIRIPITLEEDLEIVSKMLKINKSEWVKTRLSKDIFEEKKKLLMELSKLYVNGLISEEEITNLVGRKTADRMKSLRSHAHKSASAGLKYGKK